MLEELEMGEVLSRNNVVVLGNPLGRTLLLAHGFGCDQNMWRFLVPYLKDQYRIILFDYVGSGKSDINDYSIERYAALEGYAQDIIEIVLALDLRDLTLVGHSVSCMISALAASELPDRIDKLVMICPSPCFLNDLPQYEGGFERSDLEELLLLMDSNYIGWANYLAPIVMGLSHSVKLIGELSDSFCSTDPIIAKTFARATFFSDYRYILADIEQQTLLLQSASDSLASVKVGEYMHHKIPNSNLEIVDAEGHCLHMSDAEPVSKLIHRFLKSDA